MRAGNAMTLPVENVSIGKTFLGFSGGKDSTACALIMAAEGRPFELLFTPTGNETPETLAHIQAMSEHVGMPVVIPKGPQLLPLIDEFSALPNHRQRWCTRMIKIEPCIAHLKRHPGATLCVGLRADEGDREGLYGPYATYRYPLREHGLDLKATLKLVADAGINVPRRTDCMLCYAQRLPEWYALWRDRPEEFARGERLEKQVGHSFRSPKRDTWPAYLADLRVEFEAGRVPRGQAGYDSELEACRVCRL
jgi:PP-loop superfamily ATP-utilizing enzyme